MPDSPAARTAEETELSLAGIALQVRQHPARVSTLLPLRLGHRSPSGYLPPRLTGRALSSQPWRDTRRPGVPCRGWGRAAACDCSRTPNHTPPDQSASLLAQQQVQTPTPAYGVD